MKINSYRPFIVISAAQKDVVDTANYNNHELLKTKCKDFVEGVGVTKQWGKERVLLVFDEDLNSLSDICAQFNQEAIVVVSQFRNVKLVPTRRLGVENLGVWREIGKHEAEAQDHTMVLGKYFKDGLDRYYACK